MILGSDLKTDVPMTPRNWTATLMTPYGIIKSILGAAVRVFHRRILIVPACAPLRLPDPKGKTMDLSLLVANASLNPAENVVVARVGSF